jgi:hypothetical protein
MFHHYFNTGEIVWKSIGCRFVKLDFASGGSSRGELGASAWPHPKVQRLAKRPTNGVWLRRCRGWFVCVQVGGDLQRPPSARGRASEFLIFCTFGRFCHVRRGARITYTLATKSVAMRDCRIAVRHWLDCGC